MLPYSLCRLITFGLGTLYPGYASYKALKFNDTPALLHWLTYWIVSALFLTFTEIFLDLFLGFWFPFYYEIKIIFILWLIYPATRGSKFIYREFLHPMLIKCEVDIDEFVDTCTRDGFSAVSDLGWTIVDVVIKKLKEANVRQTPLYQKWNSCSIETLEDTSLQPGYPQDRGEHVLREETEKSLADETSDDEILRGGCDRSRSLW